jgi:thiamine-monophosphate kinase
MTHITSEDDFLVLVDRHFPRQAEGVLLGRGDDAAVVAWPGRVCVTTDLFLEDVHFRRSYFSPRDAGYKALAVNISDVAAMGGWPLGFVLGLVCPDTVGAAYWDEVLAGLAEAAAPFALPLLGGDLDRGPLVGISITLWGRPGPEGRFLTRGTARPGDVLFAVGELGLARAGLTALERFGSAAGKRFPAAVAAHLRPTPRIAAGLALAGLAGQAGLTACMDVSDGLARDLPRLLPPGTGAALDLDRAAVHPEIAALAGELGRDPLLERVIGGEDYALLGAVDPDGWPQVRRAVPEAVALGRMRPEPGLVVNGLPLAERGFDHFG